MKLEPGERSILAGFASGPNAEQSLAELKQAGYQVVQMDRVGKYGFYPDTQELRPGGKESSLVRAVVGPAQLDEDTKVLLNATTEASGMSSPDTADNMPFLVTVVTSEDRVKEAVEILKKHGGRV